MLPRDKAIINAQARAAQVDALLARGIFPTATNSTQKAYEAALVVVLHSGSTELIMRYLSAHQRAESGVNPEHRKVLEDKIAVLTGNPQKHGTQTMT